MNYATLKSDPFGFVDPAAGPANLRAAIAQVMGREYRLCLEPAELPGQFTLHYCDDASERLRELLVELKQRIGPLLDTAIEITVEWVRNNGEPGPELHYAGPSDDAVQACRLRHAVQRARDELSRVLPAVQLDAMFAHLEPVTEGGSERPNGRSRAIRLAEATLRAAGDLELAGVLSRAANEVRPEPPQGPALWRETYLVTVLSFEPPHEFADLASIHREITNGACTGSLAQLVVEPLDREAALRAVEEIGSDAAVFGNLIEDDVQAADASLAPRG